MLVTDVLGQMILSPCLRLISAVDGTAFEIVVFGVTFAIRHWVNRSWLPEVLVR